MQNRIFSYKDLSVWKKSIDLVTRIYKITERFPKEEIYGLTSQMRRAAVSLPANIAEGSTRGYRKEYINFLSIAFGSGAELETHTIIANQLNFLPKKESEEILLQLGEIMKMLNGLIRKLKNPPSVSASA